METGKFGQTPLGKVLNVNPGRNFGFIKPNNGGANIFFYFNSCPGVKPGDIVSFELLVRKMDGKTYANNLQIVSNNPQLPQDPLQSLSPLSTASGSSITSNNVPKSPMPIPVNSFAKLPGPTYFPRVMINSNYSNVQRNTVPHQNSILIRDPEPTNPSVSKNIEPSSIHILRGSEIVIKPQNVFNKDNSLVDLNDTINTNGSSQIHTQTSLQYKTQNGSTQVATQNATKRESAKNSVSRTVNVKIKFVKAEMFIADAVTKLPDMYKQGATVCIRRSLITPFDTLLKKDDVLKVILAAQNTEKPVATIAYIAKCSKFNEEQFNSFMKVCTDILGKLHSNNLAKSQEVFKLTHATAVWEGALSCDVITGDTFHQLIKYLIRIANQIKGSEAETFYGEIMKSRLFHPIRGTCVYFASDYRENSEKLGRLKELLDCAILVHAPSKCGRVLKLFEEVCPKGEKFWIQALKKTLKAGAEKDDIGVLEWKELPLAPTVSEVMGEVMEDEINLTPVPLGKAFPSNEQYFDTYIRLLREDCFFAIKTGIKKFLEGSLDPKDMNVYKNVEMLGYVLNETGVNVVLQIGTTSNMTKRGLRTNDLQHGNLLCVSAFGSFKDPVWVMTLMRDKEFNERGTLRFLVEICSYGNQQKIYEILQNFNSRSGHLFVVESPTYYRAYEPILSSLQNSDCDKFPFKEIVINLDTSSDVKAPKYEIDIDHELRTLNVTLDASQMQAMRHVFDNQVSIIQGPPGCGKTFLGVQIVRLLLSQNISKIDSETDDDCLSDVSQDDDFIERLIARKAKRLTDRMPKLPILVLTYKNHALDEFLLQVGDSIGLRNVCRVGSRSDEPKLEPVSLRSLKTVKRFASSIFSELKAQIRQLKEEIENEYECLGKTLKDLQQASRIQALDFIDQHFSESQLELLLKNAPYINLGSQTKLKLLNERNKISKSMLTTMMVDVRNTMKEAGIANLKDILSREIEGDHLKDFAKVVECAFRTWIPDNVFIKSIEKEFGSVMEKNMDVPSRPENVREKENDSDDEEEERIINFQSSFKDMNDAIKQMETVSDSEDCFELALKLLPFAKILCHSSSNTILESTDDVWTLSPRCRLIALQQVILNESEYRKKRCDELYQSFMDLCARKLEVEERYSANVAEDCQVVAMTITGASLHRRMIESLKPSVVIVEEAAEVLEPQLIAVLGPWVKHLIMIGDHKQLPPPVQCFKLAKEYHFDLSMMERLIKGGIPYVSLKFQNRMRPSLSKYLLDIYPDLMDGPRVHKVPSLSIFKSDIFFWNHDELEAKGRSVSNSEEALRAIKLAMFLVTQNIKPRRITILSTYRGQTALIRRTLAEFQNKDYKDWIPDTLKREDNIQVHTVDMYQGDENDIVIVSLVRSNNDNKLGFVKLLNRRCVSQSRAKQAVIFIGNFNTISSGNHWESFLKTLKCENLVGETLAIKCPNHASSEVLIKDSRSFPSHDFCRVKCEGIMPCGKHACPKTCKPDHSHFKCLELNDYFEPEKCSHLRKKPCWRDPRDISCKYPCPTKYKCGHPCTVNCEPVHAHVHCTKVVTFSCSRCSNDLKKQCWRKEEEIKCKADVPYTCPVCKKVGEKVCHEDTMLFKCQGQCIRKVAGCGHPCTRLCHEPCSTSESCIHCIQIEAAKNEKIRLMKLEENEKMLQRAKKELKEAEEETVSVFKRQRLNEDDAEFIHAQDMVLKFIQPTHNWYPTISFVEKVTNLQLSVKFFQSISQLFDPSYITEKFHGTSEHGVNGIIKDGFMLHNSNGKNMYGDGVYLASDSSKSAQEMYTKSSNMLLLCRVALGRCKTVTSACNNMTGFKLKKEGFDSIYAKRDSRGTGGVLFDEFVVFDPYRVLPVYIIHYRKSAIPKLSMSSPLTTSNNAISMGLSGYSKIELTNERAASNPKGIHYRSAAGCFHTLRDRAGYRGPQKLKTIFYHSNAKLEAAFEQEKLRMEKKYPGKPEGDYILAFHGTPDDQNIDLIVRENFKLEKIRRTLHGHGIYFSEFPDVSLGYAGSTMKLLLCKVLPGKSYDGDCRRGTGCQCDSHRVAPSGDGRGNMIVMFNTDRILPCYELHLQ